MKPVNNRRLRSGFVKVSALINRNTGWLVTTAIVFFGLANLSFQHHNRTILQNTNSAAAAASQAATDTRNILAGQSKAVQALKDDNEQQTRILCRLILRGDLQLEKNEATKIEHICQKEIDKG